MKFNSGISIIGSSLLVFGNVYGAAINIPIGSPSQVSESNSIWDIVERINASTSELQIFGDQIEKFPSLKELLQGGPETSSDPSKYPNITVFAPINQAFLNLSDPIEEILINQTMSLLPFKQNLIPENLEASIVREVLKSVLEYHVVDEPLNLSDQFFVQGNISLGTALEPFSLDIQSLNTSSTGLPVPSYSQSEVQLVNNVTSAADTKNITMQPWQFVNDAQILVGFEGSNGYLYLVDKIISPLWYFGVSLDDINFEQQPMIPKFIGMMAY